MNRRNVFRIIAATLCAPFARATAAEPVKGVASAGYVTSSWCRWLHAPVQVYVIDDPTVRFTVQR